MKREFSLGRLIDFAKDKSSEILVNSTGLLFLREEKSSVDFSYLDLLYN